MACFAFARQLLHGYALSVRLVFAAHDLDYRNWCVDFGGLKPVRAWLHSMFDHTLLVAEDDPALDAFRHLADAGLADLRIVPAVGCEATARAIFAHVAGFIAAETVGRVWLDEVEVAEHSGNSAIYRPAPLQVE